MKFKYRYIFYGCAGLLLAALLIILLPIDDELDPEAASWKRSANDTQDVEDNGYYYLMGLMAAANEDPEAVGRDLIAGYLKAEEEFLAGEGVEFTYPEYPKEKALPYRSGDPLYCRFADAGCFESLARDPVVLRRELAEQNILLERYRRLLQFTELKPLIKANFYESFPPYTHVVSGSKLNQMAIIAEYLSGNRSGALAMLRTDMEAIRRHLASAPNLIGKMVMLALFANDLDLLLNIAEPADWHDPVPALTVEERALRLVMIREFGSILNFLDHLKEHPASSNLVMEGPYSFLLWLTTKPNMSANEVFPYYREIADLSTVNAAEFNRLSAAGSLPEFQPGFRPRNFGGSILNSIAMPSFVSYVARLHDVDAKIALVNASLKLDRQEWSKLLSGARKLDAVNPYRPEEEAYIDKTTQSLCFSGPFPDDVAKHRCIRKDKVL